MTPHEKLIKICEAAEQPWEGSIAWVQAQDAFDLAFTPDRVRRVLELLRHRVAWDWPNEELHQRYDALMREIAEGR